MDLENEIKKIKLQQTTIIFLLNDILKHLENQQTHDLGEKIRLFQLKLKFH